jgi:hypothetical protein
MSAFGIITACLAGAVVAVAVCAVARWRHIGAGMAVAFGAIGGLLGAIGARNWFPTGPAWGSMSYRPLEPVLGAVGGIVVILLARLVWGPSAYRGVQRPGTP